MKSKQILFFALFIDIEKIIRDFELEVEIQYYKTGLHDSNIVPIYKSLFEVPNIEIAVSGDWNRIDNYLLMKKTALLNIREVPQRTGKKNLLLIK